MRAFIDEHRNRTTADGLTWGIEPIRAVLQVAPSTHYATKSQVPSHRDARDAWLTSEIHRVHTANRGVYGAPKVWRQLKSRRHQRGLLDGDLNALETRCSSPYWPADATLGVLTRVGGIGASLVNISSGGDMKDIWVLNSL